MKGPYERKPTKEKKKVEPLPVHHCESCRHFLWGLITPYTNADGACIYIKEKAKRKYHGDEACSHWERK